MLIRWNRLEDEDWNGIEWQMIDIAETEVMKNGRIYAQILYGCHCFLREW